MNLLNKDRTGLLTILIVSLSILIAVLSLEPIPQDTSYHQFRDSNTLLNIPNFWNVLSNIPFLIVGIYGLFKTVSNNQLNLLESIKSSYILLFLGTTLVSFGSAYYHLSPDNQTLLWDRLPMSIAFMALFSIVICEFVSMRAGKLLLYPLISLGIASVVYWQYTETQGNGDLRFYLLVQFIPVLLMPLIFILFKPAFSKISGYWYLLLAYVAAKFLEHFDAEIYSFLEVISGHSLKHIVAAIGIYYLIRSYESRKAIN